MPKLTISEAARLAKTTRSTLYRAMERGDMSFELLNGKRVLDPSELQRAFPPERPRVSRLSHGSTSQEQDTTAFEQVEWQVSLAVLQRENEMLREQLRTARDEKEYLRSELTRSSSTVKALTAPIPTTGWWPWNRAA